MSENIRKYYYNYQSMNCQRKENKNVSYNLSADITLAVTNNTAVYCTSKREQQIRSSEDFVMM